MGKLDDAFFSNIPPDDTVKLVFNLSQGDDARGSWNSEPDLDYVEHPEPERGMPLLPNNPDDEGHVAKPTSKHRAKS
jgi:Mn-containing catalase